MALQDLYIGLGGLAYAVAKSDGYLSPEETQKMESILQQEEHGPIACYAFQLKDTYNTPPEEAYQFALRRFAANQTDFKPEVKEHFMKVLYQIAQSCHGISPEEHLLLKRIRKDLTHLSLKSTYLAMAGEK